MDLIFSTVSCDTTARSLTLHSEAVRKKSIHVFTITKDGSPMGWTSCAQAGPVTIIVQRASSADKLVLRPMETMGKFVEMHKKAAARRISSASSASSDSPKDPGLVRMVCNRDNMVTVPMVEPFRQVPQAKEVSVERLREIAEMRWKWIFGKEEPVLIQTDVGQRVPKFASDARKADIPGFYCLLFIIMSLVPVPDSCISGRMSDVLEEYFYREACLFVRGWFDPVAYALGYVDVWTNERRNYPFEFFLPLMAQRKVVISKGDVDISTILGENGEYRPEDTEFLRKWAIDVFVARFREYMSAPVTIDLWKEIRDGDTALGTQAKASRFRKLLLLDSVVAGDPSSLCGMTISEAFEARIFPICMYNFHAKLQKKRWLKYADNRHVLVFFLRRMGYSDASIRHYFHFDLLTRTQQRTLDGMIGQKKAEIMPCREAIRKNCCPCAPGGDALAACCKLLEIDTLHNVHMVKEMPAPTPVHMGMMSMRIKGKKMKEEGAMDTGE